MVFIKIILRVKAFYKRNSLISKNRSVGVLIITNDKQNK